MSRINEIDPEHLEYVSKVAKALDGVEKPKNGEFIVGRVTFLFDCGVEMEDVEGIYVAPSEYGDHWVYFGD